MRLRTPLRWVAAACGLILISTALVVAQAPAKKPITHDVYDSWRSIRSTQLSRDGAWLVYVLAPQDGDGEVVARNLKTGAEHRHPRGQDPVITPDGRFVAFTIAPVKAEVDKAKKDKKKPEDMPKNGLGVMTLESGAVATADRVKSLKVPAESSRFVAYLKEAEKKPEAKEEEKEEKKEEPAEKKEPEKKKKEKKHEPGTDLVVRDLASGQESTIAEVTEYVWSKDGNWLAYGVSSKAPENDGAFARGSDGATKTLLEGKGYYKGFAFDDKSGQLAFVGNRDEFEADPAPFTLYWWRAADQTATELVTKATAGMKAGWAVSDNGRLEFAKDGSKLFVGAAPIPPPEPDESAPEPTKVDLWSWKDPLLQPMQKVRAEDEKKRTYRAVVHLADRKFVQLADQDMPELTVSDDGARALGSSNVQYHQLVSWDSDYNDYSLVNLRDGTKQKILEKAYFDARLSPGAGYVFYFDDREHDWLSYRVSDGRRTNLTEKLGVALEDEDWDTPNQPQPHGTGGWTTGDGEILIYDRYDIWAVKPDGSGARNLTQGVGRAEKLRFRYQRLDPEERSIPADKPLLLAATNEDTRASGFYRVAASGAAKPEKVIMIDKLAGAPIKAKNADALVFTVQRFDEFPDLWATDGTFANPKKVSDANPQRKDYLWGTSELIEYVNADGRTLRAILTKPENFDPSKKYPLLVYIYETLSEGLHRYVAPSPGTSINVSRYVSNGYVLLQPDIVYTEGYPGESAMKCVVPAVEKVLSLGYIDPKRVGIQGHSWGGYQITYMITRTNIFRAVEAGASVSNMISAYGGIRWGSGMSRAFQYEKTQSRIGAPPWDKTLEFIENSPIFWVEKIKTPYLTIHNDEDDAVPWYQGIEFISALRRLGKEGYMFVYNGEKHGLRERENQKHWTVHMAEFFDHYLLGAPRPEWMDKGVPFLEKGKREMTPFYPKKD
jgi:dipeptidyl aminopeptidase/acylaminoacyl peptidase